MNFYIIFTYKWKHDQTHFFDWNLTIVKSTTLIFIKLKIHYKELNEYYLYKMNTLLFKFFGLSLHLWETIGRKQALVEG